MQVDNNRQGELVLVSVPESLSEIVSKGHKRFAVRGRIVGATMWIDDGVSVQEVRLLDSDSNCDLGPDPDSAVLNQLPMVFQS
jgi:hypothetical protein